MEIYKELKNISTKASQEVKERTGNFAKYFNHKKLEFGMAAVGLSVLMAPAGERVASAAGLIDNIHPQKGNERFLNQAFGYKTIVLQAEDGGDVSYVVPTGFTPGAELKGTTQLTLAPVLPGDIDKFSNFQASLNNPADPYAGFEYPLNDESDNLNEDRLLQYPSFAWTGITALEVNKYGSAHAVGGDHMGVLFLYLNRTPRVEKKVTHIVSGAVLTGRLWDANDIARLLYAMRGLSAHNAGRMLRVNPDNGFTGQCDDGYLNCETMLRVVLDRVQWGLDVNGNARYYDRFIGADYITEQGSVSK